MYAWQSLMVNSQVTRRCTVCPKRPKVAQKSLSRSMEGACHHQHLTRQWLDTSQCFCFVAPLQRPEIICNSTFRSQTIKEPYLFSIFGANKHHIMYTRKLLISFAALYGLLQLSQCSVLDSVLLGSCPVTPSKEKAHCLLNANLVSLQSPLVVR